MTTYLANDLIPFPHLDGTIVACSVYIKCKPGTQENVANSKLKYFTFVQIRYIDNARFSDILQNIKYSVSDLGSH